MSLLSWEEAVQWLRAQPGQEALVYACYYDDPLCEAAERFRLAPEWQTLRALLPVAGGRALDLGAGRGISSYALAREGWLVTALEPDPSMVVGAGAIRALAADAALPIEVRTECSEELPFPADHFDLVYCRQALHHARDLRLTCREAFRVLRPGGQFIATREHVISREADLPAFLDAHPLHHLYGGENAHLLSAYLAALAAAGFSIEAVIQPFDSPINFSPLSEEELLGIITAPVRRVVGVWPVRVLTSPHHTLGRCVSRILRALANRVASLPGRAPGRLYSFIARKEMRQ